MVIDNYNFFSNDADLLADVSCFVRSINADLLSMHSNYPIGNSKEAIEMILEDDRQFKCYEV